MHIKTLTDAGGLEWHIPQQLLDEGLYPDMPAIDVCRICTRTHYRPKIDGERGQVRFAFDVGGFVPATMH